MPSDELNLLSEALGRTRFLLQQHGDTLTAQRVQDLEARLNRGDTSAIASAVAESTGGMGSLRDRYLCMENGDAIEPKEVVTVNHRLGALVKEVEQRARAAASAHLIPLVR